ncbi:MAG: M20/M25/M40 family metallo-hydrolase [Desulfobacteraceae bacterium]|nr:MAG: M20/M25/M40 family metallo-hydrolase [Desulfobacteraceae bacterium]
MSHEDKQCDAVDLIIYKHPAELLQNLIRFDTTNPPGNETGCVNYINNLLKRVGFETHILAKDSNRSNLITRLKGQGSAPPLMLYGHVDVVTTTSQNWTYPPFEAKEVNGFIWGRGALDMKCGVAMMVAAIIRAKAEALIPRGDILLAILSDEEAGSHFGARYLVDNHPEQFEDIRYAIGEFGGYSMYIGGKKFYPIQIAEKTACWIRATVRGPSGHGARPMRDGTMANLGRFLSQLDKNRLPVHITPATRRMIEAISSNLPFPKGMILNGLLVPTLTDIIFKTLGENAQYFEPLLHNTVNATIVRGGNKINVIPGEITVDLDGRILPGLSPDDIIAELRQITGDKVKYETLKYDPYPAESDMGLFDTLSGILSDADPEGISVPLILPGVTDARIFARLGIQTYGFMPMSLPCGFNFFETIHAADERIPVEAVAFGTDAIFELLKRYKG